MMVMTLRVSVERLELTRADGACPAGFGMECCPAGAVALGPASDVPQTLQKREPAGGVAPQPEQTGTSFDPQPLQKVEPSGAACPHWVQITIPGSWVVGLVSFRALRGCESYGRCYRESVTLTMQSLFQ